jgi:hypothetical protein
MRGNVFRARTGNFITRKRIMTQEADVPIDVIAADIQAVMQQDRVFALEVQNRALMRKLNALAKELEAERSKQTKTKKED